ncbi:MAG TPA: hypothetical protein VEC18_03525 [Myxococcota bacterium]|nr:hypothetical protein [Myxococcota bacterium]
MAHGKKRAVNDIEAPPARGVESEPLKPIRKVMREIVRPDGTILRVEVPVYPPFKLKQRGQSKG